MSHGKILQGIESWYSILQVLGVTSFSLTCHYTRHVVQAGSLHVLDSTLFFVQLITFAFFFVTFLQAVAALVNSATADSFKTSLFVSPWPWFEPNRWFDIRFNDHFQEFLYNLVAAIFYLAGSIAVLSKWGALHRSYIQSQRTAAYKIWDETVMEPINAMIAASVMNRRLISLTYSVTWPLHFLLSRFSRLASWTQFCISLVRGVHSTPLSKTTPRHLWANTPVHHVYIFRLHIQGGPSKVHQF